MSTDSADQRDIALTLTDAPARSDRLTIHGPPMTPEPAFPGLDAECEPIIESIRAQSRILPDGCWRRPG